MLKNFAVYPSLLEKTVFVTGGALGIGAEIVTAFAKQGSKVGFLDLDLEASKKLAKKLGDNVHFEICDLTSISAMLSLILIKFESLPILLCIDSASDSTLIALL